MSPFAPKGKARNVKSSLLKMNQFPLDGRQMAMSAFPSPVKSPGAGMSLATPNTVAKTFVSELRDIHHSRTPAFGRVIPISVFPSPSKSINDLTAGVGVGVGIAQVVKGELLLRGFGVPIIKSFA